MARAGVKRWIPDQVRDDRKEGMTERGGNDGKETPGETGG